ncbi:MAG: hypothetical protein ACK5VX_05185, partial [Akkermansiaceae bacterium]
DIYPSRSALQLASSIFKSQEIQSIQRTSAIFDLKYIPDGKINRNGSEVDMDEHKNHLSSSNGHR